MKAWNLAIGNGLATLKALPLTIMLEFKLKTLDLRAFVQGPSTSIPTTMPHTTLPPTNQLNSSPYSYLYTQPPPPYSLPWQYPSFTQPLDFSYLLLQRNPALESL